MQVSNSSKNLGKDGKAKNAAMARYFAKMTGEVAASQNKADVFSREAVGRKLQRSIMTDKGAP